MDTVKSLSGPIAAVLTIIAATILMGPCASKDYVQSAVAAHESRDESYKTETSQNIREIRSDVKVIIEKIGRCPDGHERPIKKNSRNVSQ
jgi:hypothetical protein